MGLDYKRCVVEDIDTAQRAIDWLCTQPVVAVDTETNALDWYAPGACICGVCLGTDKIGFYFPVRCDHPMDLKKNLPPDKLFPMVEQLLGSNDVVKVLHNFKFDAHFFLNEGINIVDPVYDTLSMDKVLHVHEKSHKLKTLVGRYGLAEETGDSEKEISEWRKNKAILNRRKKFGPQALEDISYDQIPLDLIGPYGCDDAVYTARLFKHLYTELKADERLMLIERKEQRLLRTLLHMEREGVYVSASFLADYNNELLEQMDKLTRETHADIGFEFNLKSVHEKRGVLELLGIRCLNKAGEVTTSRDALAKAAKRYKEPFLSKLVEYNGLSKIQGTYCDGLPKRVRNGRVHSNFNNIVETGRLSASDPNLMNIPGKTEEGKMIRKAFYAPTDYLIACIDFSQVEMRVAAHMSQDPELIRAYREGLDLHVLSASKALHKDEDDVTAVDRRCGKTLNFAILYGGGPDMLTELLLENGYKSNRKKSVALIDNYMSGYSGLSQYIKRVHQDAYRDGKVYNLYGRLRTLPGIWSSDIGRKSHAERAAFSHVIQGTAADLMKTALIKVHDFLLGGRYKSKLVLPIHDELMFYIHKDELELVKELVKLMEDFPEYSVPIEASCAYSAVSWGHKEEIEDIDQWVKDQRNR